MQHASSFPPTLLFAAFVFLFIGFAAKSVSFRSTPGFPMPMLRHHRP